MSLYRVLRVWVPHAFIITVFSGLAYVTIQQDMRQGANDPQIQMAEDAAFSLSSGRSAASVLPSGGVVTLERSLAPFLIVYDENLKPLASSASLGGKTPTPPPGVFAYAKQYGQHRITWMPETDVREATVIAYFSGTKSGYVLAGRSLREVEKRENKLTAQVSLVWIVGMATTLLGALLFTRKRA